MAPFSSSHYSRSVGKPLIVSSQTIFPPRNGFAIHGFPHPNESIIHPGTNEWHSSAGPFALFLSIATQSRNHSHRYCTSFYAYSVLHLSFPIAYGNDRNLDFCPFLSEAGGCVRYLGVLGCEHGCDCVHSLATNPHSLSSFPSYTDCSIANHPRPKLHQPHKAMRTPWGIG